MYRTAQTISAKVGWIRRKLAIIQTLQDVRGVRVNRSHVRIHGLLDVSECSVIVLFKQLTKSPPNVSLIASINVTVVVQGRQNSLPNISNAWLLNVSGCNAVVPLKELTVSLDSTKQL